jgi:hypothetical protein
MSGTRYWQGFMLEIPVEYMSSPILQDGEVTGAVVSFKDITECKALEQQLHHQAFYDPLTGLPNRALSMERLNSCQSAGQQDRSAVRGSGRLRGHKRQPWV